MLPRVAPQTALALIANNVAEETASENQKLPYPAETGEAIKEEQQHIEKQRPTETVERNNYIVTSDPVSTSIYMNLSYWLPTHRCYISLFKK